ncbi:MAG: HDOD domain-containing protein [Oscillospiraceae bacterium]
METHIVRQPILDRNQKLVAYELVYYQDASTLYNQRDAHVANTIVTFFAGVDAGGFFEGKDCFLTFTPNLLMKDIPKIFDEKKLVIQIEENILINPDAKAILNRYKKDGYRIAVLGFDFNKRYLDLLPDIDIIKADFSDPKIESIGVLCKLAKNFGKELAAYGINSPASKELALAYGCDYLQGDSVSVMITTKVHKMNYMQSNFFRLMTAITKEIAEFDEIAKIISMDVTLSFSLLKMVNSSYFALPNKISSIKQALTILGLSQLKQWIYLLSFSDDGGVTDQLIKQSFLRAVFCQEVSSYIDNFPITKAEAYLLGMFSTLGSLLEVPIKEAVEELPLTAELKSGLTGNDGYCAELLKLCTLYEKGKWSKVAAVIQKLNLPEDVVKAKYMESVEYVNGIWSELSIPAAGIDYL